MKNKIYLTQEGKQELEAMIVEIEQEIKEKSLEFTSHKYFCGHLSGQVMIYKEILASATILPVESSWEDVLTNTERDDCIYSCKNNLEKGVIIQPK